MHKDSGKHGEHDGLLQDPAQSVGGEGGRPRSVVKIIKFWEFKIKSKKCMAGFILSCVNKIKMFLEFQVPKQGWKS